jgi:hypothetical protein
LKPIDKKLTTLGLVTELLKPPHSVRGGGEPAPTRSTLELRERAPGYIDTELDDPKLNPDTVAAAEQRVAREPADSELVVRGSGGHVSWGKRPGRAGERASHRSCEEQPVKASAVEPPPVTE